MSRTTMPHESARARRVRRPAVLAAALPVLVSMTAASAEDVSPAPILQYFESTYGTLEYRMADVFKAGYGMVYTPPPGRADTGGSSVGYDQYNRFDLGSAGNATLYGTETGLKSAVAAAHAAGLDYGVDFVMNHNGYSGTGGDVNAFWKSGGYPGFVGPLQTTDPTAAGYNQLGYTSTDGDFHSAYASSDTDGRLAGLIDIDHTTNWKFIRQPTTAGDKRNIPAGTSTNFVDAANARFYTDTSGAAGVKYLYDPKTGEGNIAVYNFNTANPSAGVAVPENALGYLMRNAQWLVQTVGVDSFRLDATKNMDPFVLNYFDRAVYRSSLRTLLNGQQKQIYSWGEYYDGDTGKLLSAVRKDIDPNDPGRIGGNRDTLDFPLWFAIKSNFTTNGYNNNWNNVVSSSLDLADDNKMNGSVGVKFAGSHDDGLPDLSNTAYAYTLMLPGQAIVYDNAKQFGNGRDFPKSGRADALGGAYGDQLTKLVAVRNVYAQGNYVQRFISKESLAFERNRQSITLLSNRTDNYVDQQSFNTGFAAGTYLVELTGNAKTYGLPQVIQTQDNGAGGSYVNASFLPSNGGDHGYLVYGLQSPLGSVTLTGVSQTLAGGTPTLSGTTDQRLYQNATTRLSDVKVVTGNSFTATLNTTAVSLPGSIRDKAADGDNALIKLDGGLDVNGNGNVDFTTPDTVSYGFENFTGTKSPGYVSTTGAGTYAQSINATGLSEGYHYLTLRAFRHREDGGPAVYTDFKETIYVDRLKPQSSVNKAVAFGAATGNNDIWIKSDDQTANSVKVFLNLPATTTDAQIIAMVNSGQGGSDAIDRDIFKKYFSGMAAGNNVYTVVTYEITGNVNVQRFTGRTIANGIGAGLGDSNHNGTVDASDISGTNTGFEAVLYSKNSTFNPSADLNGDGLVDNKDLFILDSSSFAASAATKTAIRQATLRRGNINGQYGTDAYDIDAEYKNIGTAGNSLWYNDLNVDGSVTKADVDTLVHSIFKTEYGDANLDGKVDFNDFLTLQNGFGKSGGWAVGDFTGDGVVSFNDFLVLQNGFGFGTTTAASAEQVMALRSFAASVPEPAMLATIGMTSVGLLRRRRF